MNKEFLIALDLLEKEKGIAKDILIETLENALLSAYKKDFGGNNEVTARVNRETGDIGIYTMKAVVETVLNPQIEIDYLTAKKISRVVAVGDTIEVNVVPKTFGRIAAQTAKGIIVQKIREVERGIVFSEFMEKTGDVVTGLIQRIEKNNVMLEIGRTEAVLSKTEQVPTEKYTPGERIKLYVVQVKDSGKAPQIMISRTHPNLVKRLFEKEVPEIMSGVVEIKAISREPGSRTKIAVYSSDENIDPIGSCVGQRGNRVSSILNELQGEKIDIIKWSENPKEFIIAALSPSKVVSAEVFPNDKTCKVLVPEDQLSLAIGKEGQNARLAAKLTGYKIDIKSAPKED